MVLANESVAKLYYKYPFLYRIHEKPDNEDIEKFMKIIESVDGSLGSSQKSFQSLLETLKASPKLEPFQRLLLRSLAKARYSEKNMGHFGLALDFYSHFTSPIRRYPDLQIHRIMKEIIAPPIPTFPPRGERSELQNTASSPLLGENMKPLSHTGGKNLDRGRRSHYQEILPKVARRSSETADRAEKMEYKVRDMLACKYMSDKIGEVFRGKISGMIEKGFFVELPNTIEGFIEFGFSGYSFSLENYTIVQQKTRATLQFGDEVSVRVLRVDRERYRVEFELV
jgi:ribonuclease R